MDSLSSLYLGGFELKCKARSCSSWNKGIYLSLGRLAVAAGRGVRLRPMSSYVKSGHSKGSQNQLGAETSAPVSFSAQHQRCKDDP